MREPLEESLNRAMDQLPRPSLQELSRIPVPLMDAHDEMTRQHPPRRPAALRLASCAAALLLLFGSGGWYLQTRAVASVIDLDVNPGFEITANRRSRVLEITPVGAEDWKNLPDIDFRNMPLEDAVASLVDGLCRAGYLREPESVLLLSVGGSNAAQIEQSLTERIGSVLETQQSRASVVRQSLPESSQLRSQARGYQVSEGRLHLVNQILSQEPAFSREKLLEMSVSELVSLAGRYGFALDGMPESKTEEYSPMLPDQSSAGKDMGDDSDDDSDDDDPDDEHDSDSDDDDPDGEHDGDSDDDDSDNEHDGDSDDDDSDNEHDSDSDDDDPDGEHDSDSDDDDPDGDDSDDDDPDDDDSDDEHDDDSDDDDSEDGDD